MNIRIFRFLFLSFILAQNVSALAEEYAKMDMIRGRVVAIDSKTSSLVDGYTIEVDASVNKEALAKIRSALRSHTRFDYRKFESPRRNQTLLLVRKSDKLQIKVGDSVEVRGYSIVGHSESSPKHGEPVFENFTVTKPGK